MFFEFVDASSYSKTDDKLFELLSRIVDAVGDINVVQVITDNESNIVAAGALLMANIVYALKVDGPLVHALRKVDGEKKPAMG
ncbi:hypothetical protein V6N11_067821 [Hibiscus sabdariffa]|uniref:DUF659 domain-containing protein n=1 Tax=Hibiscus sabdariffa TaxID=183260 RepID=A0ABR2SRW5_9ROSI